MFIQTRQVQAYLQSARQQFSGAHLPDASPVATAIAAALQNEDIHGLEALAKACAEAAEMALLRKQTGVAQVFTDHRTAALTARQSLL